MLLGKRMHENEQAIEIRLRQPFNLLNDEFPLVHLPFHSPSYGSGVQTGPRLPGEYENPAMVPRFTCELFRLST